MAPDTGPAESGHRGVPHTADTRIEAWAPDRARCLAEAVAGFVESFADRSAAPPARGVTVQLGPAAEEDMLVTLLEELIYRLDVDGELPVREAVAEAPGGGLEVRLAMGAAESASAVGAIPKAVSLHGLRFTRADGWSCTFTIDV